MASGSVSTPGTVSIAEPSILNQLDNLIKTLQDPGQRDDLKLKALQDISDNFEGLCTTQAYPALMNSLIHVFIRLLQETVPQFIGENNTQQLRKLMLELLNRMPCNDYLKQYAKPLNSVLFKIIQSENEENVLIAIRILLELLKTFRPPFSAEVSNFLSFCKNLYRDLQLHMGPMFEPRAPIKVNEIRELDIENALAHAFSVTPIQTAHKHADTNVIYTLLPRGKQSLKVLSDLPLIIVLLYQIHRPSVQQDIADFIPLILNVISASPSPQHRNHVNFNRELFIEFLCAQVKALSFLAFLTRIYFDLVNMHASSLVKGIVQLLELCPPEVCHLRRELLVACRHLMGSDLRPKFIPYLSQFFNDNIVVGSGWTCNDSLRPLVFSTLADLVHHVRAQLPLSTLAQAIHLFSRCLHDPTVPGYVQAICGKLILNLSECVAKQQDPQISELLFFLLEVFTRKFKSVARHMVPALKQKCVQIQNENKRNSVKKAKGDKDDDENNDVEDKGEVKVVGKEDEKMDEGKDDGKCTKNDTKEVTAKVNSVEGHSYGICASALMSVSDCRGLVKVLVCGAKTTTWAIMTQSDDSFVRERSRESVQFSRLLKYSLEALDIYTLVPGSQPSTFVCSSSSTNVRSKEEKETLDHLSSVFTMLPLPVFKEIFSTHMQMLIDRISNNYALQIVVNQFLMNAATSTTFASILVTYLIDNMHLLGTNTEKAGLYLKLFKYLFQSVSYFPSENELMLKPHLHTIVNRSMELALTARDPINYFILLRSLFRSIGGGSHDLLYQEFLPLLPSLLQVLNRLQSGSHRQHMRELFVELCLTVPVRLSSLLPYLPLLMDPLVSALKGSSSLVQQGLRTLELCVDNLQPEFLYEHMAPVRAPLMQALWKTVTATDSSAPATALRILGKFGGSNRKMLTDPQMLEYRNHLDGDDLNVKVAFVDAKSSLDPTFPSGDLLSASLPLKVTIKHALSLLHTVSSPQQSLEMRKNAWLVVKAFLSSAFAVDLNESQIDETVNQCKINLTNNLNAVKDQPIAPKNMMVYKCKNEEMREVYKDALTAMFFAVWSKDMRGEVLEFFNAVVKNLTIQAILEETGEELLKEHEYRSHTHMDCCVLIDAVVCALADSGKEYCHSAILAMTLIVDTAAVICHHRVKACELPFIEYMVDQVHLLCYKSAWYARLGGCAGIKFVLERFPPEWVWNNVQKLLLALIQVLAALNSEVSSGAVDMAKTAIGDLIRVVCDKESESYLVSDKEIGHVHKVIDTCHLLLFSPTELLRNEAQSILERMSEKLNTPIVEFLQPLKESMYKSMMMNVTDFTKLSCESQIGVVDGFAYVNSLKPDLFSFDNWDSELKSFCDELMTIVESEDITLGKRACYERKSLTRPATGRQSLAVEFRTLRITALKALCSLYVCCDEKCQVVGLQDKLVVTVFQALTGNSHKHVQNVAFTCLAKALERKPMESTLLNSAIRPVLLSLNDKNVTLSVANKLLYLARLSPNTFNEKLCDQLLVILNKWLNNAVESQQRAKNLDPFITDDLLTGETFIEIIAHIPASSSKFVEELVEMVLKAEALLSIEIGSNLRAPLSKFLARYPTDSLIYFLQDTHRNDEAHANLLVWLVKKEHCVPVRTELMQNHAFMTALFDKCGCERVGELLCYRLVHALSSCDASWLEKRSDLVVKLRAIWTDETFINKYTPVDSSDSVRFKAPRLVAKSLLNYFDHDKSQIELLFDLCLCFVGKWIADFQFLRTYLETQVIPKFAISWRREAFLLFVNLYDRTDVTLKDSSKVQTLIKVLQYVIIPSLEYSLRQGKIEEMIGSSPAPEEDNDDNIISLFSTRIIDKVKNLETLKKSLPDGLHILLYQLSCMFVEFAAPHIHDASSKRQGSRLRRFMLFAWPCLQQNNVQDPTTKYTGHLLIALIIDKFAINRKIVLQVFHSLLKAHGQDPKALIKNALNILTPAVPLRMDDGNAQLTQFAKKIITEDGHTPAQLVHLLQLIVRHYRVYFAVRHNLIQYLMNGIQRLVTQASSVDSRKLAVDVCEMILKWELIRLKDTGVDDDCQALLGATPTPHPETPPIDPTSQRQFDKSHVDSVVNFLVRMACQVPDQASGNSMQANQNAATVEALNKRCLQLLKVALKPALWANFTTLKLQWMEKILQTVDQNQHVGAVHICLDVLNFLIGCLIPEQVAGVVKQVQKGIASCLTCITTAVVRSMYTLLCTLLAILKPTHNGVIPDLDNLSAAIFKFISETLSNYDKSPGCPITILYGSMTTLRAMCTAVPEFLDRVISGFVRALVKLTRENAASMSNDGAKNASDMISLCLELIRPRMDSLIVEHRKQVVSNVLIPLTEKATDKSDKILTVIIKIADEWIRSAEKSSTTPVMRERHMLLFKLMTAIERRGSESVALQRSFLQIVLFLYESSNVALKTNDVTARLEPAFHLGLSNAHAPLRNQFFHIYDSSLCKHACDRLWYVMCMQNWEPMKKHYWVKQCIEIILAVSDKYCRLRLASQSSQFARVDQPRNNAVKMELGENDPTEMDRTQQIQSMVEKQAKFWSDVARTTVSDFVDPLVSLCHQDSELSHNVWIQLVTSLWNTFSHKQREVIEHEVVPFLCSGSHVEQKECSPSIIATFTDAFTLCQPPILIKPDVLEYIGRSHCCWHRAILQLEAQATNLIAHSNVKLEIEQSEMKIADKNETLDALASLYKALSEPDLWVNVWQKRSKIPETARALSLAQQGCFSQAIKILEESMASQQNELGQVPSQGMSPSHFPEMKMWENQWIRCAKELNQWDALKAFSTSNCIQDPFIVMDCAWRLPDWKLMKEAVVQVESCCPPEEGWKLHLYRGFVSVCQTPDESVDKCAESTNAHLMQLWRKLPSIISSCHVPLLQAAQRAMELTEAHQLTNSLQQPSTVARHTNLHDVKAVVKTWRNRSPTNWDHLSHWYDVLGWRLHHYLNMLNVFEASDLQNSLLPMHACASLLVQVSKVARKQNQLEVALNILTRLHTMPNLPTMDAFLKMYQQVKCALKLADQKMKTPQAEEALCQGLEIIEQTNISYLSKEQSAKLYALKGSILARLNRFEDANKAFSASLQLHDSLPRAWALWAEYMEKLYDQECRNESVMSETSSGLQALVCYLQAARQDNEHKSRPHLSKAIWILKSLESAVKNNAQLRQTVENQLRKHSSIVPPINFVPWIHTLIMLLRETGWQSVAELLKRVGDAVPQPLYYQARLFITTQQETHAFQSIAKALQANKDTQSGDQTSTSMELKNRSWEELLSSVLGSMRHKHPVEMHALDTLHKEITQLTRPANWCEHALRRIRSLLRLVLSEAFDNRNTLPTQVVSSPIKDEINAIAHILQFTPTQSELQVNDERTRLRLACYNKFKTSFVGVNRVYGVMEKLVEWEHILNNYLSMFNKRILLKEMSEYLSEFSSAQATLCMFSELSTCKTSQYGAKIARFLPQMQMMIGSGLARQIWVRGHDGKKYSFTMEWADGNMEKQMRIDSLFKMLNSVLLKDSETARRCVQLSSPRVVAINHSIRLVESRGNCTALIDIMNKLNNEGSSIWQIPLQYYGKLLSVMQRVSSPLNPMVLLDIFNKTQLFPTDSLKQWAMQRYEHPTHFFTFRKQLVLHLSVLNVVEFVMHLSWLNVNHLNIDTESGFAYSLGFEFDLDHQSREVDVSRPVPFRLTPCVCELLGWSREGQLAPAMLAVARALHSHHAANMLKPLLADERHLWVDDDKIKVTRVNTATAAVHNRLMTLAALDKGESKVLNLIAAAFNTDNLCRMDPAWFPGF